MTKLHICTMAACVLFAAPAFSQTAPYWEDGVAAAAGNSWWGRELGRGPAELGYLSGAASVVASGDFNPSTSADGQSIIEMQDGDDARISPDTNGRVMDEWEDNESVRLSDAHWEFTHQMADLNGDGNVSRSELMGMLEGGPLGYVDKSTCDLMAASRARQEAAGWVDISTCDNSSGATGEEGAARMAEAAEPASEPQSYEAVTHEQGVQAGSLSAEPGGRTFTNNPLSVLSARREARFLHADKNEDGGIDLEEMIQLRRAFMESRDNANAGNETKLRKQARRIIQRIDADGDRMISREELAAAQGNRMMDRLDSDGDGQISPEEWAVTQE